LLPMMDELARYRLQHKACKLPQIISNLFLTH
jgi:hypothetical protein